MKASQVKVLAFFALLMIVGMSIYTKVEQCSQPYVNMNTTSKYYQGR